MPYIIREVSAVGEDRLIGYVAQKEGVLKLEGTWIYEDYDELAAYVDQLNEQERLAAYRPLATDPEVQALVSDPNWSPVEYEDVEVFDRDSSEIFYISIPRSEYTKYGITSAIEGAAKGICTQEGYALGPDGKPVINYQDSKVVTKIEKQPKRVSGLGRIGAAIEVVARKRMEAALDGDLT